MEPMHPPRLVTFTGVDRHTSILGMLALSDRYPVEWALLLSPQRQGSPEHLRYPPIELVYDLAAMDLPLAAHLCGADAEDVRATGAGRHDGFLSGYFKGGRRVQINTARPVDVDLLARWASALGVQAIVQSRDEAAFPADGRVHWLYDCSGGRGIVTRVWPQGAPGVCRGYAGGLSPDNVADALAQIAPRAPSFWIDMESDVRDAHDRLDLQRCRRVCEAVFGR